MKNLFILIVISTLVLSCGKPKQLGTEKKYSVKVVFMDGKEDTLILNSVCPPKLSNMCCNSGIGSYLTINCDHTDKVASHVKYFSIITEK